jgi:hypothetical protein
VSLVAIIALLSRVVSTAAELICVSIAYIGGEKQVREAQEAQQPQIKDEAVGEEQTEFVAEPTVPAMVDRGSTGD